MRGIKLKLGRNFIFAKFEVENLLIDGIKNYDILGTEEYTTISGVVGPE